MKKVILMLGLFGLPALAMAHPGHGADGWMAGVTHPLTGWDHLLAMLSVGLWAATFQGKARWLIPASFVCMMIIGFGLGVQGISVPMLEQGIAVSVLVLGLAAAYAKCIKTSLGMLLVGGFALFHGMAHGIEMHGNHALAFACGFVVATVALHLAGFMLGNVLSRRQWVMRLCGSAIALAGFGMLLAQ